MPHDLVKRGCRIVVAAAIVLLTTGCLRESDVPSASPTAASASSTATHPSIPTALPTVDLSQSITDECPVTPFTDKQPSDPHLGDHPDWIPWYEHDGVWASPDDSLGGRWYTGGIYVLWWTGVSELLNVTGRPLDGGDDVPRAKFYGTPSDPNPISSELFIPEPGCWELVAEVGERELRIVVNVLPVAERVDVIDSQRRRAEQRPFAVPDDCPVSPLSGPGVRRDSSAGSPIDYWVEGDGIDLHGDLDLLFEGNGGLDWFIEPWAEPNVRGNLIDDPSVTLRIYGNHSSDLRGEHWRSSIVFPAPGCWTLSATAGDASLIATVYVYPAD